MPHTQHLPKLWPALLAHSAACCRPGQAEGPTGQPRALSIPGLPLQQCCMAPWTLGTLLEPQSSPFLWGLLLRHGACPGWLQPLYRGSRMGGGAWGEPVRGRR